MNWISSNWEKAVLLLVSLLVILVGVLFVKRSLEFKERFGFQASNPDKTLPVTEVGQVRNANAVVATVKPWQTPIRGAGAPKPVPLFVSIPIIEVDGKKIDITDPNSPAIRPPVTNQWLTDNGLEYKNSNVLNMDNDNDKFSNLEEWEAKTSPVDANAHPPYALKLVMVARRQQDYMVEFAGTPGESSFQLTRHPTRNYGRATFIKRMGEITDDGKLKLEKFEEIEELSSNGIRVDASKLTVTYLETGETVDLVRRKQTSIPTYFLEVSYKLGPLEKEYYKIGEEIVLPNAPETKYKVVDILENEATISFLDATGSEKTLSLAK